MCKDRLYSNGWFFILGDFMSSFDQASKLFIQSRTIIGIIVSVLPALLPVVGVSFSPEDGAFLSTNVDLIFQGIGAILAIYGRFVAEKKITLISK